MIAVKTDGMPADSGVAGRPGAGRRDADDADRETLVAALRERGVRYLTPTDAVALGPIDDATLIEGLASSPDPRLRQALIALFLLQPELAPSVASLKTRLDASAATELVAHFMAAVYLQRMWRLRLDRVLGEAGELPDLFSKQYGLPDPSDGHGKPGLHALAEWHAAARGARADHLSEYEGVLELLLASAGSTARDSRESTTER